METYYTNFQQFLKGYRHFKWMQIAVISIKMVIDKG